MPDVSRGPPSKTKTPRERGGVGVGGDVEMSSDDDFDDDGVAVSISFDDEEVPFAKDATAKRREAKDADMDSKQKYDESKIAGGGVSDGVAGIGSVGKGPTGGIGKAEVEAALSRFGNIKLFSLDDEGAKGEDGDGDGGLGVGYASGGSMASLDHHGYR